MSTTDLIWTFIKIGIMVFFLVNAAGLLTWVERRQSAMMQDRVGPNRAVIKIFGKEFRLAGLLHAAADGVKFIFKEDFMPPRADKLLFNIAPILSLMPVITLLAVIPFGDSIGLFDVSRLGCPSGPHGERLFLDEAGMCVDAAKSIKLDAIRVWPIVPRFGSPASGGIEMVIAPLNVGILYMFAMAGQGIVGAAIAGWSSDNKFSLMGALRAASQMVSYEVAMGLSIVGAMMVYGTVRLDEMARWQGENAWGIFVQPLAFFMFFTAAIAENKRAPFDLPEAESELVSGYFTEYSGMKFGMFYLGEFMEIVTNGMLVTTIFLGGWNLPFLHRDGLTIEFGQNVLVHLPIWHIWVTILQILTFFGKVTIVTLIQQLIRWTLPRFRYDQLMKLGWRILLPASLANLAVTGIVYLGIQKGGPGLSEGLDIAADVTQAFVAIAITYGVARLIIGFFKKREKRPQSFGTAGALAAKAGGTPVGPMQA